MTVKGFPNPCRTIIENWHLTLREIRALGYPTLTATATRSATGCDTPSVELEYDDLNGKPLNLSRWRLADPTKVPPDSKPRKYTCKKDDPVSLFLPRGLRRKWARYAKQPKRTIYITEGEAKALFAVLRLKIPCIAIQGCSGWQKEGVPAAQFDWFDWTDRPVIIIPDSDYRRKPDIRTWFARLGKFLASLGADVSFRLLTDVPENFNLESPDKSKTGLDDWIFHTKSDLEAFKKLPTLSLSHKYIQSWDSGASTLPAALRDLKPVDAAWYKDKPPDPEFVVTPYLQIGESGLIVGEAGVGKSIFSLTMHASIGTGIAFFRYPIPQPRKTLYLMCERHEQSLRRRWYKVTRATAESLEPGTRKRFERLLHENCFLKAIAGEALSLIEFVHQQWQPALAVVDALIAELKAAGITVLFLDPLSRLHGGDENHASVAAAITKALERIVQHAGCSVMLVHHTGKTSSGGMYSARGSSVFNDNTSENIVLSLVEEGDRKKLSLVALEPHEVNYDLVRAHHARCSDGRPADDLYLVRNGKTGLLRQINVCKKSADEVLDDSMSAIRKWAAKPEYRDGFSKSQFVDERLDIYSTCPKRAARQHFTNAVASKAFVEIPAKRKGHSLYQVNPGYKDATTISASGPDVGRSTGQDRKSVQSRKA
jgi:hypothetical protein